MHWTEMFSFENLELSVITRVVPTLQTLSEEIQLIGAGKRNEFGAKPVIFGIAALFTRLLNCAFEAHTTADSTFG